MDARDQNAGEPVRRNRATGAAASQLRSARGDRDPRRGRFASVPRLAVRCDCAGAQAAPAGGIVEMIKIAISGAGAISERAHLPALKAIAGVQVAAIQSRTREKAERVATALWPDAASRPRAYDDFDEMLERERPGAVGIFTPNYLHCEYTLKALAAGAHVLVEKPMAPTAAEARRMVTAAAKVNRVLMVAMQR